MPNPLYCELPNTATVRWWAQPSEIGGPVNRYVWHSLNFLTSGSFTPGFTRYQFEMAWSTYCIGPISNFVSVLEYYADFYWIVNTTRVSKFTTTNLIYPFGFGAFFLPSRLSILLSLYGGSRTRRERGNLYAHQVLDTYTRGNYASVYAAAVLTPFANFLTSSFTIGGVTFTPAIWSRAGNSLVAIDEVDLAVPLVRIGKRRITAIKQFSPIAWPFDDF